MSKKEEKKEILTGPHDEGKDPVVKNEEEEKELEELNDAIDVAEDLLSWTKTPAGRDTVTRLQKEARKAMNELFTVLHENPELGKLISAVARFESEIQMLRRFTGAEEDLDTLLAELTLKRPSASASASK